MPLIGSDFFCALTRWDFFRVFFCRINFSALSCGGFLGAVSGRGVLIALFSSGLVHVVFRIAFSVRSIGAAFYLSRFVWAFFALFQRYFFRAFFREAPLPRTFLQERLPLALSWGIFRAIFRMDSFHGLFSGLFPCLYSQRRYSWDYPREPFPCASLQ